MEKNNEILQELSKISPFLSQLDNKNPYSVSFSYFTNLTNNVVEKIRIGADPNYYFAKQNSYTVPEDYFSTVSASVLQKIRKEITQTEVFKEMNEISPLLNTINKKPVYNLPDDYFETVRWKKGEVKFEKATVRRLTAVRGIIPYMVAAVLIGFFAIGVFLFVGKDGTSPQADYTKAVTEVKKLSEQEIIDFLKTASPSANVVIQNTSSKNNYIKSIVSEMSDKEIQRFLEENGGQDEM